MDSFNFSDCGCPDKTITLTNARVSNGDLNTTVNSTATVNCERGFRIDQTAGNDNVSTRITCTSDGVWSKTSVTCVPKGMPTVIVH